MEALAQELEKRTSVPSTPTGEHPWLASPPLAVGTPSHVGGAIPKTPRALPRKSSLRKKSVDEKGESKPKTPAVSAAAAGSESGIVLRQSSWGSRDNVLKTKQVTPVVSRPDDPADPDSEQKSEGGGGGFKSNRSFWETKIRQKQTPDLVLDLPVSSSTQPMPKPRALRPTSLAGAAKKGPKPGQEEKP